MTTESTNNVATKAGHSAGSESGGAAGYTATWIAAALSAGGSLRVWCAWPGKPYFKAEMTWPGEAAVTSQMCIGLPSVIQDLNTRLQDDAAEEMRRNGAV
jgi:hypothetical protein